MEVSIYRIGTPVKIDLFHVSLTCSSQVTFPGFLFQATTDAGSSSSSSSNPGALPLSTIPNEKGGREVVEVKDKFIPRRVTAIPPTGKRRRLYNFAMKFLLDQTAGGILNIVLFVGLINLLKGASLERTWELVLEVCPSIDSVIPYRTAVSWMLVSMVILTRKQDFKPIMIARLKYRPVVSTLLYTIIPLDRRVVFGSFTGVLWGCYLSLYAAV